jgi:hypothetical protein
MYETLYGAEFKYLSSWHHLKHQPMMQQAYGANKKIELKPVATNPALALSSLVPKTIKVEPSSTDVPIHIVSPPSLLRVPQTPSSQTKLQQNAAHVQQSQPVVQTPKRDQKSTNDNQNSGHEVVLVDDSRDDNPSDDFTQWDSSLDDWFDNFVSEPNDTKNTPSGGAAAVGTHIGGAAAAAVGTKRLRETPEPNCDDDDVEALPSASTIQAKSQTTPGDSGVDASFCTSADGASAHSLATTIPASSEIADHHSVLEKTVGDPTNIVGTKRAKRMKVFEDQQAKTMADLKKLQNFQKDSLIVLVEAARKSTAEALEQFSKKISRQVMRQIRKCLGARFNGTDEKVVEDGHDLNDDDVTEDEEATSEELQYQRHLELHLEETAPPFAHPGFQLNGFMDDPEGVFKAAHAICDNFI